MRSKRIRAVGRLVKCGGLQTGFETGRNIFRNVRFRRELLPRDEFLWSAFHEEFSSRELHFLFLCSEEMRCEDLRLRDDLVDAHDNGCTANYGRTAAIGVASVMSDCRVSASDHHVFDGHSKFLGGNLGEAGLLALAVRSCGSSC